MKKHITYAMTALFATIAVSMAAPDKDAMLAKETAAWQAYKDKKADDFKKTVSADMVAVYSDGAADVQKEVAEMQKMDIKSFTISDFKMTASGADIVMTSYKVKIEGTHGGEDASGNFYAGSVWKNEKGEWRAIFHTNIEEEAAAK
jgi:hypothetical protein